MTEHVHDRSCDKTATITYRLCGVTLDWSVSAVCNDNEKTVRAHLARFMPEAVFVSVKFETWEGRS